MDTKKRIEVPIFGAMATLRIEGLTNQSARVGGIERLNDYTYGLLLEYEKHQITLAVRVEDDFIRQTRAYKKLLEEYKALERKKDPQKRDAAFQLAVLAAVGELSEVLGVADEERFLRELSEAVKKAGEE